MGLSISNTVLREGRFIGGGKFQIRDVTFDSSLASGGESVSLNQLGMGGIDAVIDCGGNAAGAGYRFQFIPSTNKLTAFRASPAGSVAAPVFTGSALGTHAHDLLVKGSAAGGIDEPVGVEGTDTLAKDAATDRTIAGAASATKGGVIAGSGGTPAGTNSAPAFTGTPAALVEAASANLSTVTQRFMFIGS